MLVVTAIYSFHFCSFVASLDAHGDKTIQCVGLFGGTEVQTGPVPKAQKGAQGPIFQLWHLHGTAALVHDDAYHMAVPITWQCGGPPCPQRGRQINFKRMANGTQNRQGVGRLPASVRSWLLGCNPWSLLCGIFNQMFLHVFTREGGGARFFEMFFEIGRRLS